MRNLTEDVILRGHEADKFMENMLHPDRDSIERREEFIHSGNFRSEERDGACYLYDNELDLSFLDTLSDSRDETSATLEETTIYSKDTKQIYVQYSCTDYHIKDEEEFVAAMKEIQRYNITFNADYIFNMIIEEQKNNLRISKEEIKYDEKMPDVSSAA